MAEKKDNSDELQEMQILDQNLHNLVLQKQAFLMDLSETKSALNEISNSREIFKLVGDLLIKTEKEKSQKELSNKEKLLEMRIKSIEKQEDSVSKRIEEIRKKFSHVSNSKNSAK